VIDHDQIQLNALTLTSDVARLEALARSDDLEALAQALADAGDRLYDGLDGLDPAFDDWLALERRRQQDHVLSLGAAAAARGLLNGAHEAVSGLATALQAFDETNETVAQIGMKADHACGDRSAVRRRYRRLCEALKQELGAAPSQEAETLFGDLTRPEQPSGSGSKPALLTQTATPPSYGATPPLAVLPFVNRSGVQQDDVFANSMVDDLTAALSGNPRLTAVAASATALYRDGGRELRQIGRDLAARYLVEGNLRRVGEDLRVTAQLVEAESGAILWTQKFDRPLAQFPALQEDLATEVAAQLGVQVQRVEIVHALKKAGDLSAWEAFLRATARPGRTTHDLDAILAATRQAVEIDPNDGIPYALLAAMQGRLLMFRGGDDPELRQEIAANIRRARALDPDNPFVLSPIAIGLIGLGKLQDALPSAERAVALSPNFDGARHALAAVLVRLGRSDEALAELDATERLAPNNFFLFHSSIHRSVLHLQAGRADEALDAAERADRLLPGPESLAQSMLCWAKSKRWDLARDALRRLRDADPDMSRAGVANIVRDYYCGSEAVDDYVAIARKLWDEAAGPAPPRPTPAAVPPPYGTTPSIAVLPFLNRSGREADGVFADGMVEDLTAALSVNPRMRVVSASTTAVHRQGNRDLRRIGRDLGARYLLEGNLRRVGEDLRVAAHLVEAESGAILWTQKFDRPLAQLSALQEDLATEVAAHLGVQVQRVEMEHALKKPGDLSAWEAWLRATARPGRTTRDLEAVLTETRRAAEIDPSDGLAYAVMAATQGRLLIFRGGVDPELTQEIVENIRRARALEPDNPFVLSPTVTGLIGLGKLQDALLLAERAVALSPNLDGARHALGAVLVRLGRLDEALAAVEATEHLAPNSFFLFYASIHRSVAHLQAGRVDEALEAADRADRLLPGPESLAQSMLCLAKSKRWDLARDALRQLRDADPDMSRAGVANIVRDYYCGSEAVDDYVAIARKLWDEAAGPAPPRPTPADTPPPQGAAPSVAILPFINRSGREEDDLFADGLVEDLAAALPSPWIQVAAASATALYRQRPRDLRQIGRELGVRCLLEGNLRRVSEDLRVTAQLVEVESGKILWTEKFDRPLAQLSVLQEDLVAEIAAHLRGLVVRIAMEHALQNTGNGGAFEALLRANAYSTRATLSGWEAAVAEARRAVEADPNFGLAYAVLARTQARLLLRRGGDDPDLVREVLDNVRRACALDSDNSIALSSVAAALSLLGKGQDALPFAERAVALSPNVAQTRLILGGVLVKLGRLDEGTAQLDASDRLGDAYLDHSMKARSIAHLRAGRVASALAAAETALRLRPRPEPLIQSMLCLAKLNRWDDARRALRRLRDMDPELSCAQVENLVRGDLCCGSNDADDYVAIARKVWREALGGAGTS
jgi:TolB-like protein/predicted Zn-dependent protease